MMNVKAITCSLLLVFCILFSSCFSPYSGPEQNEIGTISISLGGGNARSITDLPWDPSTPIASLSHTVTIRNTSGGQHGPEPIIFGGGVFVQGGAAVAGALGGTFIMSGGFVYGVNATLPNIPNTAPSGAAVFVGGNGTAEFNGTTIPITSNLTVPPGGL
jgi:hypothetical protein